MTGSIAEPAHLAPDGRSEGELLAGGEDPELVAIGCVVAAISGVGEDAADLVADGLLHVGDNRCQRMAVIKTARQRFRMQGELAPFRALKRCGDRHLDTKLVWGMRLAFADAPLEFAWLVHNAGA